MDKVCGVYRITNPKGMVYIGGSTDVFNRVCSYKNLKCRTQTKLHNSLSNYGWDNHLFEILEECDKSVLAEKEFYYGTMFNCLSKEIGLNSRLPKIQDGVVCTSDEMKQKISISNKGKRTGTIVGHYESSLKKLTSDQVKSIKLLLIENKMTQKEIGKLFNVSREIVKDIVTGRSYSTLHTDINISLRKKQYVKLEKQDYDTIKTMWSKGFTQREIAELHNITQSHVCRIVSDKDYIKTLRK